MTLKVKLAKGLSKTREIKLKNCLWIPDGRVNLFSGRRFVEAGGVIKKDFLRIKSIGKVFLLLNRDHCLREANNTFLPLKEL